MKTNDKDLNEALAAQRPETGPRPAEEFWSDFKARARLRPQDAPQTQRSRPVFVWAAPLACAALLLVAVGTYMLSPALAPAGDAIKSYEVIASHSAVLIMEDKDDDIAILWVVDMESDTGNGGST